MKQPENFTFQSYPVEPEDFRAHVIEGFSSDPKYLSPRFFYDARGSELFEQITRLPEYYPTETEKKILQDNAAEISSYLADDITIIEPGSGNSEKVELLFQSLPGIRRYIPIEISGEHLRQRCIALAQQYPAIRIDAVEADYMDERFSLSEGYTGDSQPLIFFPGSSLGNYERGKAVEVLRRFRQICGNGCRLLIGIDLLKERRILEQAYNDSEGVTAEFNKNLIARMRNQLGMNIHPNDFEHRAEFNEEEGRIEMYLVSLKKQRLPIYGHVFELQEGERILTEYSHKYSLSGFYELGKMAGFQSVKTFTDENDLFSVHLMRS